MKPPQGSDRTTGGHGASVAPSSASGEASGLLVLLPTYNEVENLKPMVERILASAPGAHILVIDDASADGTSELADRLAAALPDVLQVAHRPRKMGLGTAYVLGFRHALARGYERVVTMDADQSHLPEQLSEFLAAADAAEVVVGSRYVRGGRTVNWGLDRKALSRGANVFARRMLRIAVRDCTSGYRCYSRAVLEAVDLDEIVADGYSFQIEMLWRSLRKGFRVVEVPITFNERRHGVSKISRDEVAKAFTTVMGIWREGPPQRPARAASATAPRRAAPPASGDGVVLSIVIVSFDTADFLRGCLESIYHHPPDVPFEVMVVDNASPDGSAAMVEGEFPDVRLLALEKNVGFPRANNLALARARGRCLLLLNSDTRVLEGSLRGLVQTLDRNPQAGVVGCKQLDGDGRLQLTWGRFPTFFSEIIRKAMHWRLRIDGSQVRDYLDRKYNGASSVDWVSGSCLLARREAVEDGGLLDENIFMYFEDIDWCRRIEQRGWQVIYEPAVRIIHYGGVSASRHLIDALVAYRRSQFYFCRKYYGRGRLLLLKLLVGTKSSLAFLRHAVAWGWAIRRREDRFRAYCSLLTLKKILLALFERVPMPRLEGRPAAPALASLETSALDVRKAS